MVDVEQVTDPERWSEVRSARLLALRQSPEAMGGPLAHEEAFTEADWRERIEQRRWFLARDVDGDVVGVVTGLPPSAEAPEYELGAMWVAEHARRRGLGRELVDAVCAWAAEQGARTVSLKVSDGNTRAASLYEACGFARTGERGSLPRDRSIAFERLRRRLR